jgi:hypothetical protein
LNGAHELLIYANYVNIVEYNINAIKKNTEVLLDAREESSLEVNTEKATVILVYYHHNVRKIVT